MAATIFADRFLPRGDDRALDLATGQLVSLRAVSPGDRAAELAWTARCGALSSMCHPHLVGVVDYGLAGRGHLFEALAAVCPGTPWRARDAATARALHSVVAFLHAYGRSAGCLAWSRVVEREGRPVLLPDAGTGAPWDRSGGGADEGACSAREVSRLVRLTGGTLDGVEVGDGTFDPPGVEGIGARGRETLTRLVEVFDTGEPGRPRAVEVLVPAGVRRDITLSQIARAARLRGYVPVNTALLNDQALVPPGRDGLREALADRHVLIIHDERRGSRGSSLALFLVALGLSNSRPHVVALLGDSTRPGLQARERPAPYLPECPAGVRGAAPVPVLRLASATGRADSMASRAQSNLGAATRLAASGRHAAAERLLRESLGALSRRGDVLGAGWAATALGSLLLVRGRALQGAGFFETAREHFDRANAAPAAGRAAVHLALAWTDLGRLEEAEAAARAVMLAAHETRDAWLREQATVALARCLLWQERYGEGLQALAADQAAAATWASKVAEVPPPFEAAPAPGGCLPLAVDPWLARACVRARLAVALGDLAGAGRSAATARRCAASRGDPGSLAAAATAQLAVYGAIGDLEEADRTRASGLQAARQAHEPLRALRLRIAWLEALAHSDALRETALVAAQLARLDRRALPWVVRRSLDRAIRSAAPGAAPGGHAADAAGPRARAARLLRSDPAAGGAPLERLLEDVVEVLALCQGPQDEEAVLRAVTGRLRRRHRLAALACFALEEGALVAVASDGSLPVPEAAARRAVDVGRALAPDAFAARNEASVPVRYAGSVVGVLAGRWAADEVPDWGARARSSRQRPRRSPRPSARLPTGTPPPR